MKKYIIKLNKKTEFEQLVSYCKSMEDEGSYYGNREQYWKRHNNILKALKEVEEELKEEK